MKLTSETSDAPVSFGTGYPSTGLPGLYSRNHTTRPLFDEGEGAGAGGGDGEGDGPGYSEADFDTDEDAADGSGKVKAKGLNFKNENALVQLPGMKKPITVKELNAALASKGQYEGGLKTMGQIAEALKQQKGGGKPTGEVKPKVEGEVRDIIQELEAKDLLDGKTAAAVLREMRDGTIQPILRAVIQMAKDMKELKGHVGGFRQAGAEADFSGEINGALSALKLPRDGDKAIEGEEILKELARDLYFSFDEQDQPKLRGDVFAKEVKGRFDAYRKFFRNYEKAELGAAQRRAKGAMFQRPGAGSSGNGKPVRRLSNKQVGDILFSGAGAEA